MGIRPATHALIRTLGTMKRMFGQTLSPHGSPQLDRAIVAALFVADMAWLIALAVRDRRTAGEVIALGLVAAGCATAFLWRRHRPFIVIAAIVAGYVAAAAIHDKSLATQVSGAQVLIGVYALGSWSERRRWGAVAVAFAAAVAVVGALGEGTGVVESVTFPTALIAAPWLAGYGARMRRRHLAEVEARLLRAEAERDERARLAVIEERGRIARELHDVVAHHVSLIGVQAGAARTTLDHDPERTRSALLAIESSSRDAVREMRQLLDVLAEPPNAQSQPPAPGLAEFGRLCDSYTSAGLQVVRTISGSADLLPALQALTLYRVVEEALTNVTRHSAATSCTVHLHVAVDGARAVVGDPGPTRPHAPLPPPDAGRGLIGMRERVDVFAGTLLVGPTATSAWTVDAWLPIGSR